MNNMKETTYSDSSSSESDSDESSSDSDTFVETKKTHKDLKSKIEDESELFDKLKDSHSGVKLYKIMTALKNARLKLILQLCKKVYSGKINKFKRKHVKYFGEKRETLHECLYDLRISSMKRCDLLQKLKNISEKDDGKLLTSMLYYSSKI